MLHTTLDRRDFASIHREDWGRAHLCLIVPAVEMPGFFGPDGRLMTKDLPPSEEGMVYADLDMSLILKEKVSSITAATKANQNYYGYVLPLLE